MNDDMNDRTFSDGAAPTPEISSPPAAGAAPSADPAGQPSEGGAPQQPSAGAGAFPGGGFAPNPMAGGAFAGGPQAPSPEGPPPIINRTQVTLQRLQQFNSTVMKASFVILLTMGIVSCALALILALAALLSEPRGGDWLLLALLIFLGVFLIVLAVNTGRPKPESIRQNQPTGSCQPWNTYSCDYNGFTVWTQSLLEDGVTRFAWPALFAAREDEFNFYLQLAPQLAFIVAKDGFLTFDANAFRNLLRSVLGSKFRELKP